MSLLLCKKGAKVPYYIEKLDIHIWSMQELCYVIYNHPLMALSGFVTEPLLTWLREELGQGFLAGKLQQLLAAEGAEEDGTGTDEALLSILQACDYYAPGEIEGLKRRIEALRHASPADYAHAEAVSLFRLKRYVPAEECFQREAGILSERMRRTEDERERGALLLRRADVLCDLAVLRARRFDEKGALAFLDEAERLLPSERAARLRYLLSSAEDKLVPSGLSDEVKKELDMKREEARYRAQSSPAVREIAAAFELDAVKREAACRKILGRWKREYRRQS